jgi:Werner syndrome ATP-dependent helicase
MNFFKKINESEEKSISSKSSKSLSDKLSKLSSDKSSNSSDKSLKSQTTANIDIKKDLNKIINEYFGYQELKEEQYKIILNILNGKDVCAILPTGFGKSMCYIIPYLYTKKCVIVVCPLIALMDDQVRQLQEKNISVCGLNSNNSDKEMTLIEIYNGDKKIIFTTPEYLAKNTSFIDKLWKKNMLCCVAIDESHCVSNWGNDFRPDYQKLVCIKNFNVNIPILALTATATLIVRKDICTILQLKNPIILSSNFDRPNLYISIQQKRDNILESDIVPLINKYKNDKTIIYCKTKDDTDKIANELKTYGINCDSYHAGKSTNMRTICQEKFTEGKINCIVATIAFGLGINIPNIRLVVHYNCPSDLESYYQEIGRAGRDGKKSDCYMFYSPRDFAISNYFVKEIKNEKFKEYKEMEIKYMQKFVYTQICRRNLLLKHFDTQCKPLLDNSNILNCNNCDICCKPQAELNDFTEESKLILNLVNKNNKSYGIGTFIKILRGSGEKKIIEHKYNYENSYGSGFHVSEDSWKQIINQLITKDYLEQHNVKSSFSKSFGSVLGITNYGKNYLTTDCNDKIMLNVPKKSIKDNYELFDNINTNTFDKPLNLIKYPKKTFLVCKNTEKDIHNQNYIIPEKYLTDNNKDKFLKQINIVINLKYNK